MYSSLNVEKAYFMRGVRISKRVRFSHPLLTINDARASKINGSSVFLCLKSDKIN